MKLSPIALHLLLVALLLLPGACRKKPAPTQPAPTQPVEPPAARQHRLKQERSKRQSAVAATAPAPILPTSLPLKGSPGAHADGYPRQYVDQRGLRSLLHHGRYHDLTRYLQQYQAAFEKDPRKEYWPIDASSAFSSSEPELRQKLDAWVAATPNDFAPHLARGAHWVSAGYARRGGKYRNKTAREHLVSMEQAMKLAHKDLDRALALRPRLVAALRLKIMALNATAGREVMQPVIDRAIKVCRSCFQVRVTYIYALRPRWGGSYAAMLRFAQYRVDPNNPRHRLLPGYVDLDKAALLRKAKKFDEALTVVQRACALGEHWEFLLARAEIYRRSGKVIPALNDLSRAEKLRPEHPEVLLDRAWLLFKLKRYEASARALLASMRIDPTDSSARNLHPSVVQGLLYQAGVHRKAGNRAEALRLLDLAAELAPTERKVQRLRAWTVAGRQAPASELPRLEAAARANPDSFRAIQQLDYALARQRKFGRVVQLWNTFLAKHPNEGRAYMERGGAYYNLRRYKECVADAKKACELGLSEGCARARKMGRLVR